MTSAPMIEIIDGTSVVEDSDEEFDWSIEQIPVEEEFSNLTFSGEQCGFANSYSCAVFALKEEASEIFDIKDPHNKSSKTRREERLKKEYEQFNEDHYIADLYEDEEIKEILKFHPEWEKLSDEFQSDASIMVDEKIHFTSVEKERLRRLPCKEYLLDKSQVKVALLGLIDILFAYAYNKRTTEGENTVESGWTINKISATLSWLESFNSLYEVAHSCVRRSLCYPLYRHFELSITVLDDVQKILLLGRKYVIKCLLEIHELFCSSEPRYILNDLYITDYCVWMQNKRCSTRKLIPLANALGKVLLTKGDVGFNLVDIESFAAVAWMAHEHSLLKPVSNVHKKEPTKASVGSDQGKKSVENNADSICMGLEKLTFKKKSNGESSDSASENTNSACSELYSGYESCSSCTSDSSDSSSNTFDSDTSEESNSDCLVSSSDSDDDTESSSDSDNDSHSRLLGKESIGERLR
ncbi:Protein SHQ1-like protein, partial [Stegodyphus mimosarum]